jgi:hypothetical protein
MFAMRAIACLLIISVLSLSHQGPADIPLPQATQPDLVVINTPLPGQALQGDILITGNTSVTGFVACEISFGYTGDPTVTWFLIQRSTLPVENGLLTHWDTTTITDGDYTLQVVVYYEDGSLVTLTVPGLRVRNYSPVETDTPTPLPPSATPGPGSPVPPTATLAPTIIPSATPLPPTPTPLPTNPASISRDDITWTVGTGVGIGVGFFVLLGAYLGIRKMLHNR